MTRFQWLAPVVLCLLAWCVEPAHGCRYNVREVGFIDLGIDPYWLFVYGPQAASPDELDALLADTNIRSEIVPVGADANHPAQRFLSLHGIDNLPAAVLVSPDGQSRRIVLPSGGRSLTEAVSSAVDAVLSSPTRRQILEKAAESYGVVLLIEGPQQDRNATAREAVSTAISQINSQLDYLPKPISRGPEMVVLDQPSLAREEMLLWTLGLTPHDVNEPHAAIFYGRGRWIGPLFKGATLAGESLTQILSVIGADCECGLDHRWLQGTMLPARWGPGLQQKVTASLGFDPESPIIKMEMASIIRRGMGGFDYGGVPLGYREMAVGGDAPDANTASDRASSVNEPSVMSFQAIPVQANVDGARGAREVSILAITLGGMIVLAAVASVVILLRAKRA